MSKTLLILFTAVLLILSGCASKRLAKKGKEHQEAGFYEDAASYYYEALKKNDNNLDAKIGLRNTGQQVLEDQLNDFYQAYQNQKSDKAVWTYLEARNYHEKVKQMGVQLEFPEKYAAYYNEVKRDHLASSYENAYKYLHQERFEDAEEILKTILEIDPEYKDVEAMLREARYEPVFRKAREAMDDEKYYTAYSLFDEILSQHSSYKNAESLKEQCLEKGQVPIALWPVKDGAGNYEAAQMMQARFAGKLNRMTNPFLKVVEQPETRTIGRRAEVRKLKDPVQDYEIDDPNAVKAHLRSTLLKFESSEGRLSHTEKRGYLKKESRYKDEETGKVKTRVTYDKVVYDEYKKVNKASCRLSFKMVSAEGGEILVADLASRSLQDKMHYVDFEGKAKNLVPGYWKYRRKDSREDEIKNNNKDISALQRLVNAKRSIEPAQALSEQVMEKVALDAARKINAYKPD
ncbi:MAG: tetratricopeptide repeat protein [Bacteroidota bacterium]